MIQKYESHSNSAAEPFDYDYTEDVNRREARRRGFRHPPMGEGGWKTWHLRVRYKTALFFALLTIGNDRIRLHVLMLASPARKGAFGPSCTTTCSAEMLGSSWKAPTYRKTLRLKDVPWLAYHKMGTYVTFPASCYIWMAIEAVRQCHMATRLEPDAAAKQRC
jgi:hypothetical protein